MKQECCEKCDNKGEPGYLDCKICPCHQPKQDKVEDTKTCTNGHKMTGIGFDECPECEVSLLNEFDCVEPLGFVLDDGEYRAECGEDGDIFITKSPYYTLCQFCSPCAPGAGYVMNTVNDGVKAYCFGHDFFDDGKAPYPVYSVKTNELA